jgi:hypothetical protein
VSHPRCLHSSLSTSRPWGPPASRPRCHRSRRPICPPVSHPRCLHSSLPTWRPWCPPASHPRCHRSRRPRCPPASHPPSNKPSEMPLLSFGRSSRFNTPTIKGRSGPFNTPRIFGRSGRFDTPWSDGRILPSNHGSSGRFNTPRIFGRSGRQERSLQHTENPLQLLLQHTENPLQLLLLHTPHYSCWGLEPMTSSGIHHCGATKLYISRWKVEWLHSLLSNMPQSQKSALEHFVKSEESVKYWCPRWPNLVSWNSFKSWNCSNWQNLVVSWIVRWKNIIVQPTCFWPALCEPT